MHLMLRCLILSCTWNMHLMLLWGSTVSVHTGGIDQAWSSLKANIPKSVSTRKNGQVNSQLWTYCTQWQWRFENHLNANLSRVTAETLRSLWTSSRKMRCKTQYRFFLLLAIAKCTRPQKLDVLGDPPFCSQDTQNMVKPYENTEKMQNALRERRF